MRSPLLHFVEQGKTQTDSGQTTYVFLLLFNEYLETFPLPLKSFTGFAVLACESLDAVTGVVVHHAHTGPIVAAGYTKAIIYICRREGKTVFCFLSPI